MQQPSVRLMEYSIIQREAHLALLPSAPGSLWKLPLQRQAHGSTSLQRQAHPPAPGSLWKLLLQRQAHGSPLLQRQAQGGGILPA